jgi:hypothetical protein
MCRSPIRSSLFASLLVSAALTGDLMAGEARIEVTINRDRVSFSRVGDGGWQIVSVVVGAAAADTVGR